jgi:DNA-binding NarL/FixJ family response regulator
VLSRPKPRSRAHPGGNKLQILVVEDHPLLASTIVEILERLTNLSVSGVVRTGAQAVVVASRDKAAVVLMNFYLPDMSGPEAAASIRAKNPEAAIVFHSAEDSETALLDAIDAGAIGYLTKSATGDQILEAVGRAGRGEVLIPVSLFAKAIARQRTAASREQDRDRLAAKFTSRELDVLKLLAEGLDTIAISDHLGIAQHTIEWHVRHVIEKLDVHSKLQAVIACARLQLIDLGQP